MILYIMRHGETDWNVQRKFQGRTDIALNAKGREVAEWTKEGLKEIPFDMVFTSPLRRAKETATIIAGEKNIPIVEDERLIEMCFGTYEGIDVRWQDENLKKFFTEPECYVAPETGESIEDVIQRTKAFLEELFEDKQYQDKTILVSTHGAALSALMCTIKGTNKAAFWGGGLHKNCGFSVVEVKEGKATILKEAITAY